MSAFGERLTQNEHEILRYIAAGYANSAIATRMYCHPDTVKARLRSTRLKLGAVDRSSAVARGYETGWLGTDNPPLYMPDDKPLPVPTYPPEIESLAFVPEPVSPPESESVQTLTRPFGVAVGGVLRQVRQYRGWTLAGVVARLGTNESNVSRWERGERPLEIDQFFRWCTVLAVESLVVIKLALEDMMRARVRLTQLQRLGYPDQASVTVPSEESP